MGMLDDTIGRRELLRRAGISAAGVAIGPALLSACASTSTSQSVTFDTPADKLTATLNFTSVNYNPPKVQGYVADYMKAYPNVKVTYNVVSSDLIHDKLVTIFTGGGAVPNVVYVGDDSYRQTIDAGWIQPIDSFPGASADRSQLFPHTAKALTWKGKLYGLPYYSSVYVYGYNSAVLQRAGISTPPANLDEVKSQALHIKQAGIMEYPVLHALKLSSSDGDFDFWSLLYASGGSMFDANLKAVFADDSSAAEQVLAWLVDAMNNWKILDPASIQTSVDDVYVIIGSGKKAFAGLMDLFLYYAATSKDVSAPGTTKMTLFPGLQKTNQGTVGWTRAYSIPAKAKDIEASWTLLQYVGGQPMAGPNKGQYFAARSWFLTDALGYGFKPLDSDPQLIESAKSWVDLNVLNQQRASAKARENILVPWYFQWTNAFQQQVQKALTKSVTPRQAMQNLKKTTDDLRSQLGD